MNRKVTIMLKSPSHVGALASGALGVAISHLPQALRWVVMLGERGGLSTDEIATLAGVSTKTIELTQSRGKALVQKELLLNVNAAGQVI